MTPHSYSYALLRPLRADGAAAHNDPLLGPSTFGVEVTEAELAARCGLGNLDPQHGPSPEGRAAIEAALDCPLPPPGATLVTIRPDADAIGAMAVLSLRAEGTTLGAEGLDTVAEIGGNDRFDRGDWAAFVQARGALPRPAAIAEVMPTSEWCAGLSAAAGDDHLAVGERVDVFRRALLLGDLDWRFIHAARDRIEGMAGAWNEGRIEVGTTCAGRVAVVRGSAQGALNLGYRFAPVVVAELAEPGAPIATRRKLTIAQFATGHIDLPGVARALIGVEPGWGGSPTIIGSPQGVGSNLPLATVLRIIRAKLMGSAP